MGFKFIALCEVQELNNFKNAATDARILEAQ